MPSDDVITTTIASIKEPVLIVLTIFLIGIMIIIWKGFLPIYKHSKEVRDNAFIKKTEAEIEIEKMHEQRRSEETKARVRRDIERSAMEGRWIEMTERTSSMQSETNQVVSAMTNELKALREMFMMMHNDLLKSQDNSKQMANKVDTIFDYIVKH